MGGLPKSRAALKLVATISALFIFSGAFATVARATSFAVTNTGDNGGVNPAPGAGTGTLRQAIVDANATGGADIITFNSSVAGSISLSALLPFLTDDVTISGPGANVLTVSRDSSDSSLPAFRIFTVLGATVTISGLTMSGGKTDPNDNGGAIFGASSHITVSDSIVTGNSADRDGGGIHSQAGTLTVNNSLVFGNTAKQGGGGISSLGGTVTLDNTSISGNTATITGGGGVNNRVCSATLVECLPNDVPAGALTIRNHCAISSNTSGNGGAGIYNEGPLSISDSTIFLNSTPSGKFGAGIWHAEATAGTLDNVHVYSNSSAEGIYNGSGTLTISNSFIHDNSGGGAGGIFNGGTLNLSNSWVFNNSGTGTGGVESGNFFNNATLNITNSTISGNTGGSVGSGGTGGIFIFQGTAIVSNSTLSGNSAVDSSGGGIYNFDGNLTVRNSTVSGNSAVISGGGIFNSANGTFNLNSSIVANNTANLGPDIFGGVSSGDYNLVENISGITGSLPGTHNITGVDPMLGPLQDNGGPAFTHELLPGSPAIDQGKNLNALATDQRGVGFARTFDTLVANASGGDGTDIGAFEVQNVKPTISGATISRTQGQATSNPQIATISDDANQPTALSVTLSGGSSATVNGVSVSNVAIDASGNVTADVIVSCSASSANFIVRATDTGGLFSEATFAVNVTANTVPVLSYNTGSVSNTGSTSINPNSGPGDNGSVASIVVQSPGTYTGTVSVNNTTGIVSISNAAPIGSHTITIRATDNCGLTTDATFTLNVTNNAPVITAGAAIPRQQGSAGTTATIATVSDLDQFAGSLTVTATTVPSGISVTGINNNSGTITATVAADCTATVGANTIGLTVTDSNGGSATTNFTVNVTANTAPSLTYNNASVANGGSITINPASGPADNVSVQSVVVQSPGTYTGTISVNNTTGVVSISNAGPIGSHTITIRAADNCGLTTDATFTLNVTNNAPAITAGAAITRQQGSAGTTATIATVSDLDQSAGSLTVTATTVPSGISVTGISNNSGTITAIVAADCTATVGANTVGLKVTDSNGGSATANFTVNVTANAPPALTYNNASVASGGSSTSNPASGPADNGSVQSVVVQSHGTYTGTISVNGAGVVSISNAGPIGSHSITIRATDNCGLTTDATFTLNVTNNAPTITASASVSRQQGGTLATAMIATVSDADQSAGSLTVTATTIPSGISVTGIANNSGTVTANIAASCTATVGANTIGLSVTDSNGGSATANFTVNVTANTGPTLSYNNASVPSGRSVTINPASGPGDNGSVQSIVVQSQGSYTGNISVDNATGVVSVSNAGPVGSHTIAIRATDNCGSSTDASFTLQVGALAQPLNISTRLRVDTGDKVMIGGFIITGVTPKKVVLRGLGPSLINMGMPAASVLNDPFIELHGSGGFVLTNDNWKESPQRSQIEGTTFQPTDDRESVILTTLPPAAYTVILKGVGNASGVGVIEVYDNNQASDSQLANISTRGFVQTGNDVLIAGFVLGGNSNATHIAVRALGPSLAKYNLAPVLADPTLALHDANGTTMISNDDWQTDQVSAAQLTAAGLGPSDPKESGIVALLSPGQFTAIVSGKNGGIGIGLVEIYNLK